MLNLQRHQSRSIPLLGSWAYQHALLSTSQRPGGGLVALIVLDCIDETCRDCVLYIVLVRGSRQNSPDTFLANSARPVRIILTTTISTWYAIP